MHSRMPRLSEAQSGEGALQSCGRGQVVYATRAGVERGRTAQTVFAGDMSLTSSSMRFCCASNSARSAGLILLPIDMFSWIALLNVLSLSR